MALFRSPRDRKSIFPSTPSRARCRDGTTIGLFAVLLLFMYAWLQRPFPQINPRLKNLSSPDAAGFSLGQAGPVSNALTLGEDDDTDARKAVRDVDDWLEKNDGASEEVVHDGVGPVASDFDDYSPEKLVGDKDRKADKEGPASEQTLRDRDGEIEMDDVAPEKAVRDDADSPHPDDSGAGVRKYASDVQLDSTDVDTQENVRDNESASPNKSVQGGAGAAQTGDKVAFAEQSTLGDKKEIGETEDAADPLIVSEDEPVTEFRRNELPNKTSKAGDLSCFLYDRPPRSGSSTMGRALRDCLRFELGFTEPKFPYVQDSNMLVTKMMTVAKGPRRLLVSKHLRFSREDLAVIRRRCRNLFYVTSCRPMRERLWSRQKYKFNRGNINNTLTKEDHESAIRKLLDGDMNRREELFLEGHPYVDRDKKQIDVSEEEKLVPDYVVRNDPEGHFGEDLRALLESIDCGGDFEAVNMHVNEHESDDVFRLIKLSMGDVIYRKLKIHGDKVNAGGLKRAAAFMAAAGEEA